MDPSPVNGSCLCGQVTFTVTRPFLFFQYCHCSRCQKISGSAHAANIFVKVEQFQWTSGQELVNRYELPTAKHYCSAFCTVCGSRMPWESRNGRYVLVPAGTLDEDPEGRPERNVFWASRAPWYVDVSTVPTFDEGP